MELYIFALDYDGLRVSCDQLCAQVSKYQDLVSIKHVSNIQELPIAALIPLLILVLILPGCPSRKRSQELNQFL